MTLSAQAKRTVSTLESEGDSRTQRLLDQYRDTRRFTEQLSAPLEIEDYVIQSMPDVSPTKWHLGHTSWFFETNILVPNSPEYRPFNPQYPYLFNSYYVSLGPQYARLDRGLLSRPTVKQVYDYRLHMDEHIEELFENLSGDRLEELLTILEIGIHHERQHQELMLTDIKHVFSVNPLNPVYNMDRATGHKDASIPELRWISYPEGVYQIGHDGKGFAYDNELERHRVFLNSFQLASRLVTNREFLEFIADGGYEKPLLWLSDGWNTVQSQRWNAPLYWEKRDRQWWIMTLSGLKELDELEPVCHVSYYEADAFSRWRGDRLATESEWEVAARDLPIDGNFVESGNLHPVILENARLDELPSQMFGDVWEWTQSHYSPYPGFRPLSGALGEYNGKFMANQFVLRGGSCATSQTHIRPTYRNFFQADARWQFSGIRLARDKEE